MTKDAETWSLLLTHNTVENVKWCNYSKPSQKFLKAVPQKVKQCFHVPKNSTPRYIPTRNEGMSAQNKRTCMQMFIGVFLKGQKAEVTLLSIHL